MRRPTPTTLRRTSQLAAGVAAVVLILAGCSGDDAGSSDSTRPGIVLLRPVLSVVTTPLDISPQSGPGSTTPPDASDPTATVVLEDAHHTAVYTLGPAGGDASVFERDAEAVIQNGAWGVIVSLRPGPGGADTWNALAAECYAGTDACPGPGAGSSGQLAIEVDGVVVSAPTINAPEFAGLVSIAGNFSKAEADDLADTLRSGALPSNTVESIVTEGD